MAGGGAPRTVRGFGLRQRVAGGQVPGAVCGRFAVRYRQGYGLWICFGAGRSSFGVM